MEDVSRKGASKPRSKTAKMRNYLAISFVHTKTDPVATAPGTDLWHRARESRARCACHTQYLAT